MLRGWFACALLLGVHCAGAQPAPSPDARAATAARQPAQGFAPGVAYEKRHVDYTVERDGRFVKDTEVIRLVLNEAGVQEVAQSRLAYSKSLQSAEVLLARVITPEGKEIDVPAASIFEQEAYASQAAPMFSDHKVKAIVFPQVTVGARIHLKTRITQRTPFLPNQFSAFEFVSPHSARRDFVFTVTAPTEMPLHVQAIDLPHQREELADGRVRHLFRGANEQAVPSDPGSVARGDYSPRMVVSSMAGGADLARAYRALLADPGTPDPSAPTPRVTALAQQLTQGIDDPRLQAKALYDWVRLNIRYVNVVLERGGFVPRPLDSILSNAYGDCKDHATLLGALLRAKGIESTPVLINAGNAYWMPEPGALQAFNHMITYVPALDLYLDATGRHTAFDTLPTADAGKQVLHVANGQWARTPLAGGSSLASRQLIEVAEDGGAQVKIHVQGFGEAASGLRAVFTAWQSAPDAQLVTAMLAQTGANGSGTLRRPDLGAAGMAADFDFDYSAPGFVDLPGPGAIRLPATPFGALAALVAMQRVERRFPFPCPTGELREETEIRLPANVRLRRNPAPETHSLVLPEARIDYRSTVQREGSTLKLNRTVTMAASSAVCTPGDVQAQRAFVQQVERSLRTPLLYE